MQILSLKPKLEIFDEIDAGLDIINLEKLMWIIQDKLIRSGVSLLLITHGGNILQFLEPDVAHVLYTGNSFASQLIGGKLGEQF
jgi:Fe-S cluster assembly ATPase SufC